MKKTLLLVFVLGLFFPALLFGQNFPSSLIPAGLPPIPSTDAEGGSFLSSMPLLKGVKLGKVSAQSERASRLPTHRRQHEHPCCRGHRNSP